MEEYVNEQKLQKKFCSNVGSSLSSGPPFIYKAKYKELREAFKKGENYGLLPYPVKLQIFGNSSGQTSALILTECPLKE